MEQLRAAKYRKLRKTLTTVSSAVSEGVSSAVSEGVSEGVALQPPIFAIERWQARCRLIEMLSNTPPATPSLTHDPLLPSTLYQDPGLIQDFIRASYTEEQASEVATTMAKTSHTAVVELQQHQATLDSHTGTANVTRQGSSGVELSREEAQVRVVKHKHSIDFLMAPSRPQSKKASGKASDRVSECGSGSGSVKLYKLNHAHYEKLLQLFQQNNTNDESEGVSEVDLEEFHERVYALLSRYHSLLGHGFQAALNEQSFQV
jgi:hypothetical protein